MDHRHDGRVKLQADNIEVQVDELIRDTQHSVTEAEEFPSAIEEP